MQLDFFPSRTLTLYLAKLFVVRILAVLVMLVLVLLALDLLSATGKILAAPGNGQAEVLQYASLRLPQLAQFGFGEKTVADQFIERLGAEMALGDPADRLDVAQAARARLHVRFEVVSGVVVAVMA